VSGSACAAFNVDSHVLHVDHRGPQPAAWDRAAPDQCNTTALDLGCRRAIIADLIEKDDDTLRIGPLS
jgi:hypothetical protein